jgi:uncharacterized protein
LNDRQFLRQESQERDYNRIGDGGNCFGGLGVMALFEMLQENRSPILAIATKHGAFNVRVFGSVVRGEETPESDIDFLVDYDAEKTTPWFPGGLLMDLQDLLQRKVDVLTERGISPLIRERILAEAKPL